MRFQKTFHAEFTINLVWSEPILPVVKEILLQNNHPYNPENWAENKTNSKGSVTMVLLAEGVLSFPRKPTFKTMSTVAHECLHLWQAWNIRMGRNVNPNEASLEELEVDAYFFSEVCDWVYKCATGKEQEYKK